MIEKSLKSFEIVLAYPSENRLHHNAMIPMGIASIAAVLEESGFSVKIVDFNFYKGNFQDDLKKWQPKIVGIGGTTPTRKGSFRIAKMVKSVFPNIPVVYGGPHATFTVKDTLSYVPEIDFIIKGEAEFVFLDLCKKFIQGGKIDVFSLPGLGFRKDGKIVENRQARINNLSQLPMPARHLFENDYPMKLDFCPVKADFIMTSRGCPANCSFCVAARMFPGGVRLRAIAEVQKEIDFLVETKDIKGLKVFDSTFTANREHVLEFCKMVKPYHLLWECEIRVDTVDYELLKEMKEAGCCYVDIGLETTSPRLLREVNKRITVKQAENVLEWCKELGIKTKLFFIFGHIGQTFKECLDDVKWIRKHRDKIDYFANSMGLKLFPGTWSEKQAMRAGILPESFSWAEYSPPFKNLIFLEIGDVYIVDQKQLPFLGIFLIGAILNLQGTNLYSGQIMKLIKNYGRLAVGFLKKPFA